MIKNDKDAYIQESKTEGIKKVKKLEDTKRVEQLIGEEENKLRYIEESKPENIIEKENIEYSISKPKRIIDTYKVKRSE